MTSRLEEAYLHAGRIVIDKGSRLVCMSDCHRGVGNHGDNFLPNRNLFLAALEYYYDRCFCYVELGDGDELWENREFERIVEIHSDIFEMLSRFCASGRLVMLYGNHDCQKKSVSFMKKRCRHCGCGLTDCPQEPLDHLSVQEGVVLVDRAAGHEIFLVHGHQGELLNDRLWYVARFLVRYVWRSLEMLGVSDPTSAARNYKRRRRAEKRLTDFAREKQILVMSGHTHRPALPAPGEGLYLNDGSCVHPSCITAMEIQNGALTLVKWSVTVLPDRRLAVVREVLEGPHAWEGYWNFSGRA